MCLSPQYTDLIYIEGTRSCESINVIFGCHIQSQYASRNIKFGVNPTFHVPKTSVYQFDLYGRYRLLRTDHEKKNGSNRTLWTDQDNFWLSYLELVHRPKYQNWCESNFSCSIFNTNQRMDNTSLCGKFQVYSSLCSDAIVFTTGGRTDRIYNYNCRSTASRFCRMSCIINRVIRNTYLTFGC